MGALWSYSLTPGDQHEPLERWPTGSPIARLHDRPTLVMFAHPRCPCSRASVGELALIMARVPGRLAAHVVFPSPSEGGSGWSDTPLWRAAADIPGVQVLRDEDGREARRFGAVTSGQTLLYDAGGRLAFSGGITSARGHAGDNAGRSSVISVVKEGKAARARTPVFGCSMVGAAEGPRS